MISEFIRGKLLHHAKVEGFDNYYREIINGINSEYPYAHFHQNPFILISAYKKAKRERAQQSF